MRPEEFTMNNENDKSNDYVQANIKIFDELTGTADSITHSNNDISVASSKSLPRLDLANNETQMNPREGTSQERQKRPGEGISQERQKRPGEGISQESQKRPGESISQESQKHPWDLPLPLDKKQLEDGVTKFLDGVEGKDLVDELTKEPMSESAKQLLESMKNAEKRGQLDEFVKTLNEQLEKRGTEFKINMDKSRVEGEVIVPTGRLPIGPPEKSLVWYDVFTISVENYRTGDSARAFNFDNLYTTTPRHLPV